MIAKTIRLSITMICIGLTLSCFGDGGPERGPAENLSVATDGRAHEPGNKRKTVIAVPMGLSEDWRDFAYLSAIPASSKITDGQPAVLALDPYGTIRPEMKDFLDRYKPESIYMLEHTDPIPSVEKGLVAYWPLKHVKEKRVAETVNHSHGRLKHLPIWKAAKNSNYRFNGKFVSMDKGTVPGSTGEITVAFWVKADSSQNCRIIQKIGHAAHSPGWAVILRDDKDKHSVRFRVGAGGWHQSDVVAANCYKPGQWLHLTFTHSEGVSKIYVNGYLKAARDEITWSTPNNTANPLEIGKHFTGMIDDLRIYDRELDEIEIQRVPGGDGATPYGLLGHWAFEKIDTGTIKGRVNGHDLAIEGSPKLEGGKNGYALQFNKGDALTIGKTIGNSKEFAVSFSLNVPKGQNGYLIKKASFADGTFPWNVSVDSRNLSFQIGDHDDNRITLKDAIEYGKEHHITAIFLENTIRLYLDDKKVVGRLAERKGSAGTTRLPYADALIDNVKIYHLPAGTKDTGPELSDDLLVAHWLVDKQAMQREETTALSRNGNQSSLYFNGINTYVDVETPPSASNDLTISCWVKPERAGGLISRLNYQIPNKGWAIILDKMNDTLKVQIGSKDRLLPKYSLGVNEFIIMNQWNHIACAISRDRITMFLNGKQVIYWERNGIDINEPNAPLIVGSLYPGEKHFKGEMKDLRFHNRILSEEEVLAVFAEGSDWRLPPGFKGIKGDNEVTAAESIARMFWKTSPTVVISDKADYKNSLCASAMAARMRAPLLYMTNGTLAASTLQALKQLDCRQAIIIGDYDKSGLRDYNVTNLRSSTEIIGWLRENEFDVDYFAAANPQDRALGSINKVSLAAPLLAAGRNGAVAILDFETILKRPFKGTPKVADTENAKGGKNKKPVYPLTGSMSLNGVTETFVIDKKKGRSARFVTFTSPDGKTSPKLFTGDRYNVGDKTFTLSLWEKSGVGKGDLWMTWPGVPEIKNTLKLHYDALGKHPKYLCFLGLADVIPPAIIPKRKYYISDDMASDHAFLNTDDDPFIEIAPGRLIGEDVYSAVLTATRNLNYDHLIDESWSNTYGTSGWFWPKSNYLKEKGLSYIGHHTGKQGLLSHDSPFRKAALIFHAEHSSQRGFGGFMSWYSRVLLSPALINSDGCSTMCLESEAQQLSVPNRALRNGAVCIIGNSRNGIAQQSIYSSELLNALLMDKTVGEAHLFALNRSLLSAIDRGETDKGGFRYQYYIRMLYGDPALKIKLPSNPLPGMAHHRIKGSTVTVHGPREWALRTQNAGHNSKNKDKKLFFFHGSGVGTEAWYHGKLRHRWEEYVYTAEASVDRDVTEVKQITKTPTHLGSDGKFWIDRHQDGSSSVFWRVKFVDTDPTSKDILKKATEISFEIK